MIPHAYRNRPPEPDQLRPRDVLGFLVGLAIMALLLVLGLATGPVPT